MTDASIRLHRRRRWRWWWRPALPSSTPETENQANRRYLFHWRDRYPCGSDLPVPTMLLDILLGVSPLSVVILMTVLFIRAVDFNSFSNCLVDRNHVETIAQPGIHAADLVNMATSTDAAGDVIQAFGGFMMGGNAAIGIIVFSIL